MENCFVLCADIGGSHITAALIDLDSKKIISSSLVRHVVDSHSSSTEIINSWAACITEAISKKEVLKISLAIPGPFDYKAGISLINDQNKYGSLYRLNVKELLGNALNRNVEDISMHNDAACFLQGEVFCGSLTGCEKAIGVTLGTGLGTAVYKNGEADSADLWNLPFKDGIAEDYLSSDWFVQRYFDLTGNQISGVKDLINEDLNNSEVKTIFEEFSDNLSHFILQFIKREESHAIVIGGNIANSFSLFSKNLVPAIYKAYPKMIIKPSALGENAALFGAAGRAS